MSVAAGVRRQFVTGWENGLAAVSPILARPRRASLFDGQIRQ